MFLKFQKWIFIFTFCFKKEEETIDSKKMTRPTIKSLKTFGQKMLRTRPSAVEQKRSTNGPRCVEQIRQMTWLEVRRLWSTGLSGFWALSVFLVVGHAACHITGPSVILSVILAAITSALSGRSFWILPLWLFYIDRYTQQHLRQAESKLRQGYDLT